MKTIIAYRIRKSAAAITHKSTSDPLAIDHGAKNYLIKLAREALEAAIHGKFPPSGRNAPRNTTEKRGVFVTLLSRKGGKLRGCIGNTIPEKAIYQAVIDNTRKAALEDDRFDPNNADTYGDIEIEISILSLPEPVPFKSPQDLIKRLVPGKDGIILEKGQHSATYLPTVWRQLPEKLEFLQKLSQKAGMDKDGWQTASMKRYRTVTFRETRY